MDPLIPPTPVLVALGSIAIHSQEAISDEAHAFDTVAIESLLDLPHVKLWLEAMGNMGLLPVTRKPEAP